MTSGLLIHKEAAVGATGDKHQLYREVFEDTLGACFSAEAEEKLHFFRGAAYRRIETVVGVVIVALADFTQQSIAFL